MHAADVPFSGFTARLGILPTSPWPTSVGWWRPGPPGLAGIGCDPTMSSSTGAARVASPGRSLRPSRPPLSPCRLHFAIHGFACRQGRLDDTASPAWVCCRPFPPGLAVPGGVRAAAEPPSVSFSRSSRLLRRKAPRETTSSPSSRPPVTSMSASVSIPVCTSRRRKRPPPSGTNTNVLPSCRITASAGTAIASRSAPCGRSTHTNMPGL